MKNTFGQNITYTLFGESHGEEIGIVIDGLTPGMKVDTDFIAETLSKRRPGGRISTTRCEADEFRIVSGVWNGRTTGTPVCILIPNTNTQSKDYSKIAALPRPGHADFTAECKYHGFQDYRGGGHFSGRVTAGIVAAGAILISALKNLGVVIGTHIAECAGLHDTGFNDIQNDVLKLENAIFPVLDEKTGQEMIKEIERAKADLDSIGGIAETAISGLPAGVGEPWFDTVEGMLSHALFGIGGIKGISFGDGFSLASMRGSVANDAMRVENGKIITLTNRNGGVNGGITNGMPVTFRCAVKPTPSVAKEQKSVDFIKKENVSVAVRGRHDPAIIRRICPVIDSVTALTVCDLLVTRFGTDVLTGGWK
ncbi:MAG: chorismate synthase [Christensenellaceae bacterium]|nr:chorismate synthase [Christensenellaceae bacterium]